MKRVRLILRIVKLLGWLIGIVSGSVYLADRFGLWGAFTDVSSLSYLPAVAFALVLLADIILDAKRPKYL